MKNTINICGNVTIKAKGTHTNGNCKAVLCVDDGRVFTSMTDAATELGCSIDAVSNAIRGTQKTCKGKHLVLLSKANEYLPKMAEMLSQMEMFRAKAYAYDRLMHQQEKERKANEKRIRSIHIAEKKVALYEARCKANEAKCTKYQAKLDKSVEMLMKAQEELVAIKGNGEVNV